MNKQVSNKHVTNKQQTQRKPAARSGAAPRRSCSRRSSRCRPGTPEPRRADGAAVTYMYVHTSQASFTRRLRTKQVRYVCEHAESSWATRESPSEVVLALERSTEPGTAGPLARRCGACKAVCGSAAAVGVADRIGRVGDLPSVRRSFYPREMRVGSGRKSLFLLRELGTL